VHKGVPSPVWADSASCIKHARLENSEQLQNAQRPRLYESAALVVQKGDPSPVWTDRASCTTPARQKNYQLNCT